MLAASVAGMPGLQATLHLLRVFCGARGSGGNPLAVFLDGGRFPASARQGVARELGLSETVFVDAAERGEIRIFTPAAELDFAGHPSVGTAWLLAHEGYPADRLRPPAGELAIRIDADLTFVLARPDWGPAFEYVQLPSAAAVDAIEAPPRHADPVEAWAWLDEGAGLVRARVFLPGLGVAEDEATGSAAVGLCARVGRSLEIRQGRGSRILTRPLDGGWIELGGRVELDGTRVYSGSSGTKSSS